jgi:hypothetical protein
MIKKSLFPALAAVVLFVFTGCSKIYFHNGDTSAANVPPSSFHHIGFLELVEFSPAVDLKAACGEKDWETVRTELTFLAGVVRMIPYNFIYQPWGEAHSCKQ